VLCASALAVFRVLPVAVASRIAGGAGNLAFRVLSRRRALAVGNILSAGIADSPREARRIARASFRNFAHTIVGTFLLAGIKHKSLKEHFDIEIPPATQELFRDGKRGVILVSGHIGNWEAAAIVTSFFKPLTVIQRPMNNPYIQRLLVSKRLRSAFATMDKHVANPHRLVTVLRSGGVLAILPDQHATSGNIWIDFFGRPASTYVTPAVLHLLTRAPIVMCVCLNTPRPLHYAYTLSEPMVFERTKDRAADTEAITRILSRKLEEIIRANPEQYLWAHRRWRTPPAEADETPKSPKKPNPSKTEESHV
jgi:KDO2-lipid IV(A) lauroyltransferase